MPSLRSKIIFSILRNRHLLKFRLKKERWDWNTSVADFRKQCEDGARRTARLPADVRVMPVKIDGLPDGLSAEWIYPAAMEPETITSSPVIFYTHGGAYVSGSCSDHRYVVAKVVSLCEMPALLYEYRLAPEHPFPAAMDDTLLVYRWLLAQGVESSKMVIFGESAGGGLSLAALLAMKDLGLPLPAAGVALSPWTDLKLTGESYRTNRMKCMSPLDMSKVCSRYYAEEHDLADPWISPYYGDLHGLPPIGIYVGGDETMRDDSVMFAGKARAAGVDVILKVEPGMGHCYPFMAPLFPEASQAMAEISGFIKSKI